MLRARGLISDASGFVSKAIAYSGLDRDSATSYGIDAGVAFGPCDPGRMAPTRVERMLYDRPKVAIWKLCQWSSRRNVVAKRIEPLNECL